MQRVRHVGQSEHDHLEGYDHGEGAQAVEQLGELGVHAGYVPGEHAAEYEYRKHARHGDDRAVQQAGEEALAAYRVYVVRRPGEGFRVGKFEGSGGADGLGNLQAAHEHHEDRVHPQHTDYRHHYAPYPVGALLGFCHYCCTSLLRVARSWISEIATTTRQNITALAWPMPFHCGPERE